MGREAYHLFPSGVEVMCDCDCISTSHLSLRCAQRSFTVALLLLGGNNSSWY